MKKPHFRWNDWEIREPKLEIYVIFGHCLRCFEKFLAYAVFLQNFIVVRHQMALKMPFVFIFMHASASFSDREILGIFVEPLIANYASS